MKYIIDAITSINPNAQVDVHGNTYDGIVWRDTPVISEADINAKLAEMPTDEEIATAKATTKASGNTKLLDLGLTQAEATALTGYTPE